MPEYINDNSKSVFLRAADGKAIIKVIPGQRITLPEFFDRYLKTGQIRRTTGVIKKAITAPVKAKPTRATFVRRIVKPKLRQIVGKKSRENPLKTYQDAILDNNYSISNNIGVGILSYNRPESLKRLMASIIRHTNLRSTTIFISDDASDNPEIGRLLESYVAAGAVCLRNTERLGIAGNTNRLLRCLSRFDNCILLNDDVEVLQKGWESFYSAAMRKTRFGHFCYRQVGVYGAKSGSTVNIAGVELKCVTDKPHGAVMAFTNECFKKIGYFDEKFGVYGMEHIDWSTRVHTNNIQRAGYFDVSGSEQYFKIHPDKSSVNDKNAHLKAARAIYTPRRTYVCATNKSLVPSVSYIVPIRLTEDRQQCVTTVINNIKAQKFPVVEIILAEHDSAKRVNTNNSIEYIYIGDRGKFNKSKSYNYGVLKSSHQKLIMHDGDLLVRDGYTDSMFNILEKYDAAHVGQRVMYMSKSATNAINEYKAITKDLQCDRLVLYFEGGSIGISKQAFYKIGGYDEDFVGYGNEDTEFFDRVSRIMRLYNERSEQFIHLWHGRVNGWEESHAINKSLEFSKRKQSIELRVKQLKAKLGAQ